jgi:tRNA(fMet)-specific endonuclease VapC
VSCDALVTRYALDTNTLSSFMRGEGAVAQRLLATSPQHTALPAIVAYEVRYGLQRAKRSAQLLAFERMLEACQVLDFDADAASHAADIRLALEANGTPIGPHDLLIAATARRNQCTLVTHNTREFSRVPGLHLEDWY